MEMRGKNKERIYIDIRLRSAEWNRLKNWLDNYENVMVALSCFPKACLINMTRLEKEKPTKCKC